MGRKNNSMLGLTAVVVRRKHGAGVSEKIVLVTIAFVTQIWYLIGTSKRERKCSRNLLKKRGLAV